MRVGILTYHRANNYGAILQCFALQELLKKMGHDVQVIDYRQPFIEDLYRPSLISQILRYKFHPSALIALHNKFEKQRTVDLIFETFRDTYLNQSISCTAESIPDYDVYIVGSDQVWSIDCVGNKVDSVYFGLFNRPKQSKLIGFSISSNIYTINMLGGRLDQYVQNFDKISLREQIVANAIKRNISKDFLVTLDPTLCTDISLWDNIINRQWETKKYVVLYHVMLRFAPIVHDILLKQVKRIAELHGWDIVDLSVGNYSVSDFVSVIKYAQCVITSSFHATVFSIIFSRPLFSVRLHDGNDGRYVNLLKSLHMEQALVDLDFAQDTPVVYDYNKIHEYLLQLKKSSLDYLQSNLQ